MTSTGQVIASLILGVISFTCLAWSFYHLDSFTTNIFGNLLVLVVGIICAIIACSAAGIIGGGSDSE